MAFGLSTIEIGLGSKLIFIFIVLRWVRVTTIVMVIILIYFATVVL